LSTPKGESHSTVCTQLFLATWEKVSICHGRQQQAISQTQAAIYHIHWFKFVGIFSPTWMTLKYFGHLCSVFQSCKVYGVTVNIHFWDFNTHSQPENRPCVLKVWEFVLNPELWWCWNVQRFSFCC
jgi:hypothetical protein